MSILKNKLTEKELENFVQKQSAEYVLDQYLRTRIALEEDIKKGRYNAYEETVRKVLRETILRRMKGNVE